MRLFKTGNKQGLSTLARSQGVKPRTLVKQANQKLKVPGHSLPNPTKVKTMESISSMRKNPGIGAGLQRLESRKASALNTGGTPWSGKPLTYMGNISRAGTFNTLLQRDPGFQQFVRNLVGNSRVQNITPRIKETLAKTYISLKRRGGGSLNPSRAANPYSFASNKVLGKEVKKNYWDLGL